MTVINAFTANFLLNFMEVSMRLLPPANEVCEGYVFTGVCLSRGGCLPHSMLGYTPSRDTRARHPLPPGTRGRPPPRPEADTHLPQGTRGRHPLGRHPPPDQGQTPSCAVHAGIQSTSGRYASNWNAFLFFKLNLPFTVIFSCSRATTINQFRCSARRLFLLINPVLPSQRNYIYILTHLLCNTTVLC